ncbi:MAG: hypothetical protein Q4P29_00050 [Tissierellia bacterium]|nr:hypothetical protein [Tissierellia bacterium]
MKKLSFFTSEKNEAFSLVEIILGMAILAIIFISLTKVLNLNHKTNQYKRASDEIINEIAFGIEYLKNEINSFDELYIINDGLGFAGIVNGDNNTKICNTIAYKLDYNSNIIRKAKIEKRKDKPNIIRLSGNNILLKKVESAESNINPDNKLLTLKIRFKDGYELELDHYIRCNIYE